MPFLLQGGPKLLATKTTTSPTAMIFAEGLRASSISLRSLAGMLASPVGSVVVDKTGLADNFDIALKYSILDEPPDATLPSIFTA